MTRPQGKEEVAMVWFATNSGKHHPVDGFISMVHGVCVEGEREGACSLYPLPPLSVALYTFAIDMYTYTVYVEI